MASKIIESAVRLPDSAGMQPMCPLEACGSTTSKVHLNVEAANPAFADILPTGELEILGIVVGQLRPYWR